MKLLFCFLILLLSTCTVLAQIETCTEVTNCSETIKNKCNEMSESLKELDGNQKLILACKNGICMCNIEYPEAIIKHKSACQIEEKEIEKEMKKEQETTVDEP